MVLIMFSLSSMYYGSDIIVLVHYGPDYYIVLFHYDPDYFALVHYSS